MEAANLRFRKLAEHWFLTEPTFFEIFCTHKLTMNPHMPCPVRTGKGRIEYNPELIDHIDTAEQLEELVGIEMIRLLLKHPYERTPDKCPRDKMKEASDLVLSTHYRFKHYPLKTPKDYELEANKHYEWYLTRLLDLQEPPAPNEQTDSAANRNTNATGTTTTPSTTEIAGAIAGLWEEDEMRQLEINEFINNVKNWGNIPEKLTTIIVANTRAKVDYRKVLNGFRAGVLSSKRCLTRMKPNRRTGFNHMGSRHDFSTNLLIAVDVSGSVKDEMLSHFYSVITKFFKYGIENIDVIQFDCAIQGEALSLKKAKNQKSFNIKGRGGTNFQPVFDYLDMHNQYDGLIILTDGYAPAPHRRTLSKTRVLWICEDEKSYEEHHRWMRALGRVCYINLK